jgi:quercetin dioxygenase-like cupin family protein
MLLVDPLQNLGDIRGARYDFEKAGDVLPKHVHSENDNHITIVARGRVKAYSHDWSIEATAGQLIDFRAGEPHELAALEDNTRIFNIIKKHGGVLNDSTVPVDIKTRIGVTRVGTDH